MPDPMTIAMLAGLGINAVGQFMGAANEDQINAANLNFRIQQYNNLMKMATGNMAHGVNPFAQQMLQFVGQPLMAGNYGNAVATTGGTPSWIGPQQLPTSPLPQNSMMASPQMNPAIQPGGQVVNQSAPVAPAAAPIYPDFVQQGDRWLDRNTGKTYTYGEANGLVHQIQAQQAGAAPVAQPVQQANSGYPVSQKPAWVDEYLAMSPEQLNAALSTAQEGTPQFSVLTGLTGGYGAPNPAYRALVSTNGYWSGSPSTMWSPEDQQAFGAFQTAPANAPLPNVAEPNSRFIINGYEYSVPRGDPRADQLAQGIVPDGLTPTNTPQGQGGGGYTGGIPQPTFQPGAGVAGGGVQGNYNFSYNPALLGAAPQVQAPQGIATPQMQASLLNGFQPFQAQQPIATPQMQTPLIGGLPQVQAPQLGATGMLNAPSLGALPQLDAPLMGAPQALNFNGIQAPEAQAPGAINVQQAQAPGAVTPQFVSGVGTSGFNPGQDGLLQMMRRDVSAPMDASINPELQSLGETFDNSSLFKALGNQDQRLLDEQVNQLRGSVGSFGQRFGSGLLKAEADLRGDFLANTGARNAQIQANAFEAGMGRQAQGLGMRIGREQFAAGLPFQNAAMQLQAAQGAAGNALQGSGMDLQAQLANQSAALQAGQFNAGMQSQTNQFNAGNALTADLARQGLLGQYGLANVQNNLEAQRTNLGAQLQAGQFNIGNLMAQQQGNQAAQLQAGQFNIGNLLNQQQFGAGQQMQAGQFNLANLLNQQQFGAGQQMQAGLANQGLAAQMALANQQAGLQTGQFNIGNLLQNSQFGAGQNLQAGLAGQDILSRLALANQASQNQAQQFNIGNFLQNAQFGQGLGMQAGLANQNLAGQYGMANQAARNQAGQFNAQMGLQGAQFGAQRNDIYNQLVMQALGQANAAQQGTNQYNLGLMGLMAGVQVPQAQPSPWPGAIGEIGSMAMMAPLMYDFLKK